MGNLGTVQGWAGFALNVLMGVLGALLFLWRWSAKHRQEITTLQRDHQELKDLAARGDSERPTKTEFAALRDAMEAGFATIHRELAGFEGHGGLVAKVLENEREIRSVEKTMRELDKGQTDARHESRTELQERFNRLELRLLRLEGGAKP